MDGLIGFLPIIAIIGVMIFFSWRSNKKRTKAENDMRDNLRVGDEITTIGGIVGKIVSLRDETMVIETSKDKTHIRFLRAALRSVDVKAEDSVDPRKAQNNANNGNTGKGGKKPSGGIERAEMKEDVVAVVEAPAEEAATEATTQEPRKRGKKAAKAKRAAKAEAEAAAAAEAVTEPVAEAAEPVAEAVTEAPAEVVADTTAEISAAEETTNA